MRDNQFRTVDTCWIWSTQLKHARFTENLAVAATVAKLWLDRRIPRNLLPWNEQALPFFRRILFLLRRLGVQHRSFRFIPRTDSSDG